MDISPIAAVDVGTSRVRVLVGIPREDDHLQIIGLGECPSQGVRKGEIADFDASLNCLKTALELAEENAGASIKQVFVSVAGGHIQSLVNRGSIPIIDSEMEILQEDVDNVIELAGTVNLPPDRDILHSICQHYYLDDQRGVINPVGMEAAKLAADVLIIHGSRPRIRNLVRLIKSVPLDVEDTPLAGLCAALAVLQPDEKAHGALVIDLGGGTTDYLGYADNTLAVAGSLGVGGDHITNDIARGLRIPIAHAEDIKETTGSAIIDMSQRVKRLELPSETGPEGRVVRIGDLHTITSVRVEEILEMVRAEVDKGDLLQRFGAGVVLTGGGAHMNRVTDLAEKIFGVACRVGKSRDISGLASVSSLPEYATVIGLLRYASRTARRRTGGNGFRRIFNSIFGAGGQ